MSEVFVEVKNISKRFPGVLALDQVSMTLRKGEVHGLLGENGAGKSTLIKCLTGVNLPEEGEVEINGQVVKITSPRMAMDLGISCIYQELNIVSELSITDNIYLGNPIKKAGILDYKTMHRRTKEIMSSLGLDIDPKMRVGDLGVGQQQMVEIGRALSRDVKFLIMDEPTSSLSENEVHELMKVVNLLRDEKVAILFVSHKLEEVFQICDMVTILRDGKLIKTAPVKEMTNSTLIENMVGRTLDNLFPKEYGELGEEFLRAEGLSCYGVFRDISFHVRGGEVLGFSGLVGAGRTEVFRSIFGVEPLDEGRLYLHGEPINLKNPRDSIKNKLAFVTENRKEEGLILNESVSNNLTIVCMRDFASHAFLNKKALKDKALGNIDALRIKTTSSSTPVGTLSGGNQQKVVIGKWLNTDADVYILDEPTRGIDVGAKVEVYKLINDLVKSGKAVIMISSELPEILGMSDRVIVMREGKITGHVTRGSKNFCEKAIMKAAWGGQIDEEEC